MSDHTQADAGRERDPIPTARESDQDRQALSAPVDESASAHADPPAGAPPCRAAAGLRLDAWRERGADRMDPVRFRFMEALERRAAPHAGAARALLDQRLAALLDAYAADLERDEAAPGSPAPEPSQAPGREAQDCAAADTPIDAPLPADTLASLARALDTGHAVPWRGARSCRCWTCTAISGPRSVPTASCANRNSRCPTMPARSIPTTWSTARWR